MLVDIAPELNKCPSGGPGVGTRLSLIRLAAPSSSLLRSVNLLIRQRGEDALLGHDRYFDGERQEGVD